MHLSTKLFNRFQRNLVLTVTTRSQVNLDFDIYHSYVILTLR